MAGRGRRLAAALSVVAAVALVAGSCSGDGAGNDDAAGGTLGDGSLGVVEVGPGEAIQIRSVLTLSGDANSGTTSEKAVRLAVAHYGTIHGFDVSLGTPVDDGCSPEGGERAGTEIAADAAVIGVIGTTCSAAAVTAAPLVTGANKVMISPSNTSPRLTSDLAGNPSSDHHEGYYRTADNDLHQARTMAQFLRSEKGVDAVAAIHNGDAYTQSLAEAFAGSFEELGGSVTGVGVVTRDETDLVPALTDLASGSPGALFFPVSRTVGAAIVQQLPDVTGLDGTLRLSGDGLLSDAFLGLEESEGMFLSGPNLSFDTNANQSTGRQAADLLSEYEDAYGTAPEAAFWAHAYDATTLLLEAIEAASRPEGESLVIDLAGVREYLDNVSGYGGIIGSIDCDDFGDCGVRRTVVVEHLDSGDPAATRSNTVYEYVP
jgi:branched-chain amino acid transport system substrate-binding protein